MVRLGITSNIFKDLAVQNISETIFYDVSTVLIHSLKFNV